jgi:hypothetical protein
MRRRQCSAIGAFEALNLNPSPFLNEENVMPCKWVLLLGLLSLVIVEPNASAWAVFSPDCLPTPLPTTPVPPVVSRDVTWGSNDKMHLDVWRHPCQNSVGSFPVIRVTPQTVGPLLCGSSFTIVQGGAQFDIRLTSSASSTSSFCGDLFVPITFILRPGTPAYDDKAAFTLIFNGSSGGIFILEIPAGARPSILTVFATMIAANTAAFEGGALDASEATGPAAVACGIAPLTSIPATFSYQTTDPVTNALTGSPNTPVDIPAGSPQAFVLAFTPIAPFPPTEVQLSFDCSNTPPATVISGLNTVLLSASATPVPDVVALGATLNNDGIVDIRGVSGTGVFSVATVNVGAAGSITASADTGTTVLPVTLSLCETNPVTGSCISTVGPTVTTPIGSGQTPTFAIFVKGNGLVAFNPGQNRVVVRFKDATGATRGATSVAVRTK